MIARDFFEKQLNKREKLTVYSEDNVPHTVIKKYHLTTGHNGGIHLDLDCKDLEKYCELFGLTLKPTK